MSIVVPSFDYSTFINNAVNLPRYAQLISYPETKFFGLNRHVADQEPYCQFIWGKFERDMIAKYLAAAEAGIEKHLGYFTVPKWIEGERHRWADIIRTDYSKVISLGTKVTTTIATATLSLATDPVVISETGFTSIDEDDIRITYPNTDYLIYPSSLSIVGDTITINIPKSRLVDVDNQNNLPTGNEYADDSIYTASVEIKTETLNTDSQATLIWEERECEGCATEEEDVCALIASADSGMIKINRAEASIKQIPDWVEINYLSGETELSILMEDAIIRLAHSKMPSEPCGCSITVLMWESDRAVPETLTTERLANPFGTSEGAWNAWSIVRHLRVIRGSFL